MTQILDKKEAKFEREGVKLAYIKADLEFALSNFRAWRHKIWQEYEEKGGGKASTTVSDDYSGFANYYYKFRKNGMSHKGERNTFIQGDVIEPLEPVKMRKGTKLVLKDRINTFKAVVKTYKGKGKLSKIPLILTPDGYIYASKASAAMKKKMLVLELSFDADGNLYSPKTYNDNWEWQSKAIWFRSIGMGHRAISIRINKSLNSIKSMFLRLKMSNFFKPYSSIDWATTGYGRTLGETPSGWRVVLQGGSSGMLYPTGQGEEFEARQTIGEMTGAHREGLLETEHFSIDYYQKNIKRFNLDRHKREITKRNKQSKKHKKEMVLEQRTIQEETLQKNILNGFNLKTGKYKEVDNG